MEEQVLRAGEAVLIRRKQSRKRRENAVITVMIFSWLFRSFDISMEAESLTMEISISPTSIVGKLPMTCEDRNDIVDPLLRTRDRNS